MRRILSLVLALSLVLSLTPAHAAGTRMTVTVSARMIYNDHVGNEWTLDCTLAGVGLLDRFVVSALPVSKPITLSKGDRLEIHTLIRDGEKYPDTAEDTTTRTLSASDIRSGFTLTVRLLVTEDKGRYKGNDAAWEITYEFRP